MRGRLVISKGDTITRALQFSYSRGEFTLASTWGELVLFRDTSLYKLLALKMAFG
jgi:hypothetical protein